MRDSGTLGDGLMWYAVFLFSTVCHEAAHAWSASKLGDDTAKQGGQVSLNPVPHIRREPFGMVLVPLLSWFMGGWLIGWASAPITPSGHDVIRAAAPSWLSPDRRPTSG